MVRGLYISASGSVSESKRMDAIANNIANVNTAGFKRDDLLTTSFPDVLIAKIGGEFPDKDILRNRKANKEFDIEEEGEPFTATTNSGFFNVQTNLGISRNRTIRFKVNDDNYLVTPQGDYILGANGFINTGGNQVTVDERGQIVAGGTVIDSFKISNPINVIGNINAGVHVSEIFTDFSQGHLDVTGNPLDLAIQGKGFFAIEVKGEERYTRDGSFTINKDGFIVNKDGHRLLGEEGYIRVENNRISVNERGELYSGDNFIDRIKILDFADYKALRKEKDSYYTLLTEDWPDNSSEFGGIISQGYLEASNVNSIKEMVEMINLLRSYDASQRLIKAHDELLGRAVNDIAKI
ncbi:MAG: flagellar hook-basal body protein [Firmicutes bacterium]|nr:flagellar hook-basal body protein [Bacillota bacterium]